MNLRDDGQPRSTLAEVLRWRAERTPNRWGYSFLDDGEREAGRLTYSELDRQARAVASALLGTCAPGDRALLLLPPGLEFVVAFFGCLYAGAVAVPAYPPASARRMPRLAAILEDCEPRAVLASAALPRLRAWTQADRRLSRLPWIEIGRLGAEYADAWRDPGVGPDDLAFLQYTSGSTSAPKGVMVSHGNLMANEALIRDACGHSAESVFVNWLPLYHDLGLIGNVLQAAFVGAPCVLMTPAAFLGRPLRWLEAVSRYRGTTSGGPNFAYDLCAARAAQVAGSSNLDLSSWCVAFNGAEPVRADTLARFGAAFRGCGFRASSLYPCYGLAEATLMVTGGAPNEPPIVRSFRPEELEHGRAVETPGATCQLVSSGRPLGGQTVCVVDPDSAREIEAGQVGEIWVAGPSVAGGYWRQDEESAATFGARLATGEGPFLRTGDLGFFAPGGSRELFVTGRIKDLIILRGRNLYPQDLELAAERSHAGLRPGGGAAFSIEVDGEERLVLVLEVERHERRRDTEGIAGIAAAVRQALAEEHDVQAFEVVLVELSGVPRTTSGKVQRRACRSLYLDGRLEATGRSRLERAAELPAGDLESGDLFAAPPEAGRARLEAWLRRILAARLGPEAIDPRQPLTRYGLDSLLGIEIGNALEERFGIPLPVAELLGGLTLSQVLDHVLDASALARTPPVGGPERLQLPDAGEHPLSSGQRGLWFLHRLAPESPAYNLAGAARLPLPPDLGALERALQALVDRHAALRTTYVDRDAGPVQLVASRSRVAFERADASGWREDELWVALSRAAFQPFDLCAGPVFRAAFFERSGDPLGSALVLAVHHIAADFASLAILARELGQLYSRFASEPDEGVELAAPELRVVDFAAWEERRLAGSAEEGRWEYWREHLRSVPPLDLAPDRPLHPGADDGGATVNTRLPAAAFAGLKALARERGGTPFMVLAAGLAALLGRRAGQEVFLLGAPATSRSSDRLAEVVGYFVNPLPLRIDLSGDPSSGQCVERLRREVLNAFAQELPFVLLTERLQPEREPGRPQLLQAMLAFQEAPAGLAGLAGFALGEGGVELALGRLVLRSVALPNPAAHVDLLLTAAPRDEELGLCLQVRTALFDPATAGRMLGHLGCLLAGMAAEPERRIWEIPLVTAEERSQLLAMAESAAGPAAPARAIAGATGLHEPFELLAAGRPEAVALIAGRERLTYAELEGRSRALALRLRRIGVKAEERVAVCVTRSPRLIEALLGVLRAGGAYVPIDPAYPPERQAFLLADSAAAVLLTETQLVGQLPAFAGRVVLLDAPAEPGALQESRLPGRCHPDQVAYLIYTSGSTGLPKAVAIRHGSAVSRLAWAATEFSSEQLQGVLAATSVCFDLSIFELFVPLSTGGALVLASDALALSELPAASEVTLINTVPSAMAALVRAGAVPVSVRVINLAGEPLHGELVSRLYALPGIEAVYNLYGPSEDTTYSTGARLPRDRALEPAIGRPLPGTRAMVLDRALEPVPVGVHGELWLGGGGLARGYLGRPDLTAGRFRPDPHGGRPGERLYRTGDLARWRPDGDLEFLGRIDDQVKVRGFRIELGEIEGALLGQPGVADAMVTARGVGPERRLVAYVEREGSEREPTPAGLAAHLASRLPHFMIPSLWVILAALPRTPNGKVDRRALPEPEPISTGRTFTPPRTPLEERLARIWAALLGVERVGIDDSFFALGGHSLLATRVLSRLREEVGVELPLRAFLEGPTVAALAAAAEHLGQVSGLPPVGPAPPGEPRVLSFSQERIWLLDRLEAGTSAYNMPLALQLRGDLDSRSLSAAWNEVVRRHEVLRTAFPETARGPVPMLSPAPPAVQLLVDLAGLDAEFRGAEADRLAAVESLRPFDLGKGPVLRVLLLRLEEGEHRLVAVLHHVAGDAWSVGVLARELNALYDAFRQGRPSPLPEPPLQYADFARWQRERAGGEALVVQLSWWRERLRDLPTAVELPAARTRGAARVGAYSLVRVPQDLASSLAELGQHERATPFMVLLAGFAALLARYTGQTDICVGVPVAGRNRLETEGLLGVFLNTLAIRADLSGDPGFRAILARVREAALGSYAHQDLPFERLLEELQPERELDRSPLFQVLFNLINVPTTGLGLAGLEAEPLALPPLAPKLDLTVYAEERDEGFELRLHYDAALFEAAQMELLGRHLLELLGAASRDPERLLSALPLSPEVGRRRRSTPVANAWAPFPPEAIDASVPERFAAIARAHADRPALIDGSDVWTYADLDRAADRGARGLLAALGDGPGRVGLLFAQGAPRSVALLAALKAGKTCVPLDPGYPPSRLAFQVADAAAAAVLTDESHRELARDLTGGASRPLLLGEGGEEARPVPAVAPDTPAYILYTSGSTGEPKGVVQSHRNLLHHVGAYTNALHLFPGDRLSLLASFAFDAAVMDAFGALLNGAALCPFDVLDQGTAGLPAWVLRQGITVFHSTPTLYRRFLDEAGEERFPAVRLVVLGGEKAVRSDFERFRRHFGPESVLVNGLGPTESTLALQFFASPEARIDRGTLPVGFPVEETEVRLLNQAGEQAALYGVGEIAIRSRYLALGYWRRPELTEAAFLADPEDGRSRIYRTGDLGRRLPDGSLEFVGRADSQVKVRGQRVEMGEIEARLNALPGVREAVVVALEDASGEARLAAYLLAPAPPAEELRRTLRTLLQEAMVPSFFVAVPAWPLTPTGKVDRQALPAPEPVAAVARVAPATQVEELLAGIFASVLGLPAVGATADFFDLGGHSLLATQVVSRVRRILGVEMPLRVLFEAPTVSGLAARVEGALGEAAARPAIEPQPWGAQAPLSFAQERLWFLDRLQPGSAAYVMPAALRLSGALNVAALRASLAEVVRRHAVLRATFVEVEGLPLQAIRPPQILSLPVIDLSALPATRREEQTTWIAGDSSRQPFDLATGPLLRARLVRVQEDEHLAALALHHIAADGWSLGILAREVAALYSAAIAGEAPALPVLPIQYADFASWQRGWLAGGVRERQLAWWRQRLAGMPEVLELPSDRPRPPLPTLRGGSRPIVLAAELSAHLHDTARREGSTLFMLLLAAFQAFLHRLTGEEDLCVGMPIAGRTQVETEGLIGLFANTLVMRGDLSGDPSFHELLGRAREGALAAFAHQDLPFEKLVEALQPDRALDRSPLFQVLLALQNAPGEPARIPGLDLRAQALPAGGAKLDLSLSLTENPDGLSGLIEYAADLFDAVTLARWERHLSALLAGVADQLDRPLSALPLLSEPEVHQIRFEWCDTVAHDGRDGRCLHALLVRQAGRTPGAVAVVSERGEMKYGELEAQSRRLASRLCAEGIGPGSFVPLLLDSGPGLVVSMLAVMRAGAAFVPLDVDWPAARRDEVLAELAGSSRGIVLLDASSPALPAASGRLPLEVEPGADAPTSQLPDPEAADPESPIYAIYTSGSTGRPKAAVIPHRGIVNRFLWMERYFGAAAAERVLQTTRCVYDSAVWQIFWPLMQGGRTVLTSAHSGLDAEPLAGLIERHQITTADFVPAIFNGLVERLESGAEASGRLASLRAVVVGGEEMEGGAARALRRRFPGVNLVNLYGPTEASIGCICHPVEEQGDGRVPIGRPISNVVPRVLDRRNNPVPMGVSGELSLAGRCVGHGYLGDEEKTRQAFLPDPLAEGPARMYRTGDRARWLRDGRLDFLGRLDQQIKIRGLRIEPGEIEAVLRQHPRVAQAVILPAGDAAAVRLVAYVTLASSADNGTSERALRRFLADRLPAALIPSAFVLLEALPLSAGGKVDRKALAALALELRSSAAGSVAPRTPAEQLLVEIWSEVLGCRQPIGVHDDFFTLGGHSLLAMRVVARVRRVFGIELPVRALFEEPTVAGLARRMESEGRTASPPIEPVPRGGELPLSFAQQRLWFMEQLQSSGALYNLQLAARLAGPLDLARLIRAVEEVVRRHESLRTSFPTVEDRAVQLVSPPQPLPLPVVSLEGLPLAGREEEVRRRIAAEARRPFDLSTGPLLRCELLRLGAADHVLLLGVHHTVCDGWSIGLLERDLGAFYEALAQGEAAVVPELPVQYADYAVWQRERLSGEILEQELSWWRDRLKGTPAAIELPADRPRPAMPSYRGVHLPVALPAELAESLRALGRQRGSTLFMVLLAALDALLHRYTGEQRLTVGTPAANRGAVEIESLIGNFANILAVPVAIGGDPTFGQLLDGVRETALAVFAHQDFPFELLVQALSPRRDLSHNPLFQVFFGLHGLPPRRNRLGDLDLVPLPVESGAARFDLALDLFEGQEGLRGSFEYATDLFDASTVVRMRGHLETLLAGALAAAESRLSELPLLTVAERRQLQEGAQSLPAEPVSAEGLHELVERQARIRPADVAVVCGDERLTYRKLDRRANALAWRLRELGVGPECRVGVHVERGVEMVVALLGVLKAGGAYVPLDPTYPAQRTARILESAAPVVLVRGRSPAELPAHGAPEVWLGGREEAEVPPSARVTATNLAYVIFTSGSTGQPKGVQIQHASAVHLMEVARRRHGLGEGDVWTMFHSFAFDLSVWEIWGALTLGGRLVIVPLETARAPERFRDLLVREEVTVLSQTPSALRALCDVAAESPTAALRLVVCGGEAFPRGLAPRVRAWGTEIWNFYGPTETTVWASAGLVGERMGEGDGVVPLGSPLPGYRLYVVDAHGQALPAGVPGELEVAGVGLARGYLGDPGLTAERFAPDPFGTEPGARLYRTGDLVRRLPAGELEYLGRIDHQLKVRGFRIEPGEIESALQAHPSVRQAVVVLHERGDARRLVAFLVGRDRPATAALRSMVAETVPEYMVPSGFTWLDALPLTPSGKVDRQALMAMADSAELKVGIAPRTPVEELIAGIWSEVLGGGRPIGADDEFFALGGHSLLATRVLTRLRGAFGVELPLRSLFEAPVLAALAVRVEAAMRDSSQAPAPALRPVARHGALPLSFSQERLWFIEQLQPGTALYTVPAGFRVAGRMRHSLLEEVLTEIVRRHEALRTRFEAVEGVPRQWIERPHPFSVPVVDLSGLSAGPRSAELALLSVQEARRSFDLERGPTLRSTLVELGESEQAVLLSLHHIAGDGWSMEVLRREVAALYVAFSQGRVSPLPELPIQYADFAVWQREWLSGEVLERQVAYWRERLAGSTSVLEQPLDRPRPPVQDFRGGRESRCLPGRLSEELRAMGRREGATLFMVLLAGFVALLSRRTGQERVVVGTPIANRTREETEGLVGFFVNTLALTGDLRGAPRWRELLARLREESLGAYAHQDLPFEKLVEELLPRRELSTSPLFQVLLVVQSPPREVLELPGLRLEAVESETGTAKFDLTLTVSDGPAGLTCGLGYQKSLFEAVTVRRLLEHFERLLWGAVSSPEQRVRWLPMLSEAERAQLLLGWNDTANARTRREACLHELISAQALRTPEAEAVRCEGAMLRYRELEEWSGRVAGHLRDLGVSPEVPVGLLVEQSLEGIVGLVGILKAGGAYVPLDPNAPAERLGAIVEDSGLSIVVTCGSLAPPVGVSRVVRLEALPAREGKARESGAIASNMAYVLYTSGSTGRPKGVMVEHRSVVNYALAIVEKLGLEAGSSFAQVQPLTVDSSVTAIYPPLLSGGCVHVVRRERSLDGGALAEELSRRRVDGLKIAPSHLSALRASSAERGLLPSRWLIVGGEASKLGWLRQLGAAAPECAVFNHYGPTEATVGMLMYRLGERPGASFSEASPVGEPLANCQGYLLDAGLEPVASGTLGRLYIGGACVARGYLGRPELTAERFVPDPYGGQAGGRLYDSGDLMRQTASGELVFAGRLDHQVKIRGFRIELGEIEAAVVRHPQVREVVARVWEEGSGGAGLVVYVVARRAGAGPGLRELRRFLANKLPDYMVPSAVVELGELPRSAHGKLDLKALPVPAASAGESGFAAARTPTEELLAVIWGEILGRDRVGRHDDFFEIGGHSLLATQALSRVRSGFGVEVELRALFEAPTLEGFAGRITEALHAGAGVSAPPLVPVRRDFDPPLSFAQQRLWFLDQLDPGNPLYNIGLALRVAGPLAIGALARSLEEIVRRHEVLRTVLADRGGVPVQVVLPPQPLDLPRVDLSSLDPASRALEPLRLASEQARMPFRLDRGPLFRMLLIQLGAGEHALLVSLHHVVSDGWSMRNLVSELGSLYPAFAAGLPSPLAELGVQYADFADWQRRWLDGEALDGELRYWRGRLAGAPALLELPSDRPRPLVQRFRGGLVPLGFAGELTSELRALGRRRGATLFMIVLAGFYALLSRYTGGQDLCVGIPIAGRNRRETEDLIGFFVNTLVLRADLSGRPDFSGLLLQVRETALEAHAHQDLPFEKLLEHLAPARSLSYSPLFQVMLDLHNLPRLRLELGGLVVEPLAVELGAAKFDLTLMLADREEGLSGALEYDRDLFDPATMVRLGEHLRVLFEAAVAAPGCLVAELALLSPGERWQTLHEWNDTRREYPRASCIQDLFEAQVARTPDALAVRLGSEELTYRQLDERANRLAHWLIARGVGTDVLVALLVERSLEMIVALVGILKAGGAYAPLEPGMPPARLRLLLDDVGSPVLLTQRELVGQVEAAGGFAGPVLLLDVETLEAECEVSPRVRSHSNQLAYVNYTSGSTGQPKGVVIPHVGVTRLVINAEYMEMGSEEVILQLSTYAWDAATWEIWGALLNGGRLVLIPRSTVLDFRRLARVLVEERITALYLTTALFNQLIEQEAESLAGLGTLIIGGETASVPHFRRAVEKLPATRIINEYGPTENTSYSSWQRVRSTPEQGALPIGKPLSSSTVYVLDSELQPQPVGVPGELMLGGAGLARGYLGRAELTAERFVPHPFAEGERLYRTGDLGAWRPDGSLDFLGRMDFQVKIRGHRVEPAEVEEAIKRHGGVLDAVTVAYEPTPQERRLAAYVVPRPASPGLDLRDLRTFLLAALPDYMMPSSFVLLAELPLTSTGKVDRKALPPPGGAAAGPLGSVAPRTAVERVVAGLFQELLGVDGVGLEASFFELGGHSLLATRLVAWVLDAFGIELPLRTVFETPTVEEIAAALLANPDTRPTVERTAELLLELSAAPEDDAELVLQNADGMTTRGSAS